MKPALRLRLHTTQSQPCFPAASNALALPGSNGIFTATPTERITHYTLQAKSCANGGNPPLETPTRKGGMLSLHGAHTAFSCYPALRLYRLSKSLRGFGVVSLTLGNSALPFADGLIRYPQGVRKLLLRQPFGAARGRDLLSRISGVHSIPPCAAALPCCFYFVLIVSPKPAFDNRPLVERRKTAENKRPAVKTAGLPVKTKENAQRACPVRSSRALIFSWGSMMALTERSWFSAAMK